MIDYHVHIENGPYNLEWLAKFWERAQQRGISEIGVTEHCHHFVEFKEVFSHLGAGEDSFSYMRKWLSSDFQYRLEDYFSLLSRARSAGMALKIGLEIDYLIGCEEQLAEIIDRYPFDYLLGSVHVLGKWGFDHAPHYYWEGRDIDQVYSDYYSVLTQAAQSGLFDILAHFDVIKVFGHKPQQSKMAEVEDVLRVMREKNIAIEVSTAGLRKPAGELYPAKEILEKAHEYQIPITLASDAHYPQEVGDQWERAVLLARQCGYQEYRVFNQRKSFAEKLPKWMVT